MEGTRRVCEVENLEKLVENRVCIMLQNERHLLKDRRMEDEGDRKGTVRMKNGGHREGYAK